MTKNVYIAPPVNAPGTKKEDQRCEFCGTRLTDENRSDLARDPDFIKANIYQLCDECRVTKLGRAKTEQFTEPRKKWASIAYQMFYNSGNTDGYWRMVADIKPFGEVT